MKKLFFAMACFMGLMFFASCDSEVINEIMEQKPTVELVSEEGFISSNTSVYVGTELNFKVKVAPNSGSESPLAHFDFSITNASGTTVFNENPEFTDPSGENIFTFSYTPNVASTYIVTATVTDEAGKANVDGVTIDYVEPVVEGIGTFEGLMTINGHITSNSVQNLPAYDEDYDINDLPIQIVLGTNDEGKINATLDIDGTPVTLYATQDGDNLVFDEFHFNREIELMPQNVVLDLIINMTGVMDGDNLTLSGTCSGAGSTTIVVVVFEVNLEGTLTGELQKVAE